MATNRDAALIEAIEEKHQNRVASVSVRPAGILVTTKNEMRGADRIIATAYDHGYVPVGILESGVFRLKPRTEINL